MGRIATVGVVGVAGTSATAVGAAEESTWCTQEMCEQYIKPGHPKGFQDCLSVQGQCVCYNQDGGIRMIDCATTECPA